MARKEVKGVRRSNRVSGSGARRLAGQVVSLTRRCAALEHDVALIGMDERIRQLARRVTTLEEEKQQQTG